MKPGKDRDLSMYFADSQDPLPSMVMKAGRTHLFEALLQNWWKAPG